ncbi:MAG: potassium channel family protein [Aristaeellaceae bacterium]
MKKQKKQFIVIGLGRFGRSVATSLVQLGHEVLAVDSQEENVERVTPYVTQAVQADATDEDTLHELGISDFDAAVICIGSSSRDSILVTVLCKEAGVPMVIAKAEDELHAKILRKVGADQVVFPEQDMGQRVARSLDAPGILDMMELAADYRIAEISTPDDWCDKTLMELRVRPKYGLFIVGIRRGKEFIASPGAESRLHVGDVLLVMGKQGDIDAIN